MRYINKSNAKSRFRLPPVIAHFDAVDIGIPHSGKQQAILEDNHYIIILDGIEQNEFGLSQPWIVPVQGTKLTRYYRQTKGSNNPRTLIGPFGYVPRPLTRVVPVPFPETGDYWRPRDGGESLGWVRFNSVDKDNWSSHSTRLAVFDYVFNSYGLDYHLSRIEIAIDILDPALWRQISMQIFPSWMTKIDENLFNYETGSKRDGHGKSVHERYFWYRKNRRRQIHCHWKRWENPWTGRIEEVGRIEVRAWRPYLKNVRHLNDPSKFGINTWPDLLDNAPGLIEKNRFFSLKEFDVEKLRKDFRGARKWSLDDLTVTAQFARVMKNRKKYGLEVSDVRSYLVKKTWPVKIFYAMDPGACEAFSPMEYVLDPEEFYLHCNVYPQEYQEMIADYESWNKAA
jgi:hypothetical protein